MSLRWKPSDLCVQFWTGLGSDAKVQTLTFNQFDAYSNELCDILTKHLENWMPKFSVMPLVVIIWSPNILTSVAVHAVVKAGLCFFPISRDFWSIFREVEAFVLAVVDLTNLECFLNTNSNFFAYSVQTELFGAYHFRLFLRNPLALLPETNTECKPDAHSHLAYVITSSGSSGGPGKLAFISDACLTANVSDLCTRFEPLRVNRGSVLLTAPLTFDPSLVQIYFALATSRCLIIPDIGLLCHPDGMSFLCSVANVDWLQCTPSLFLLQSQHSQNKMLCNPKLSIIMGGETFPLELYEKSERIKATVYNIYGVTEVSCWATLYQVGLRTTGDFDCVCQCSCSAPFPGLTPIGFQMLGTEITLLPVGAMHEVTLSRGNAGFALIRRDGNPISTEDYNNAIRTLQHPKPWPTGDLVVLGSCGKCLWFAGRKDRTAKRLGHQICLETLEAAISKCRTRWVDIKHCQCKLSLLRNGLVLVAFVWISCRRIGHSGRFSAALLDHVRNHIVCYLKKYFRPASAPWIPTKIVLLDGVPRLSMHGKISRLASASSSARGMNIISTLNSLMTEYGLPSHSGKSFYDLGGSSIQAIQLIEDITQRCPEISRFKEKLLSRLFSVNMRAFKCFLVFCYESVICFRTTPRRRMHKGYLRHSPAQPDKYPTFKLLDESPEIYTSGCVQLHKSLKKLSGFNRLWKMPFGKCIDASPIVYTSHSTKSPMVCVGSHSGQFSAVDLLSGTFLWSVNVNARIEGSPAIGFDPHDPTIGVGTLSGNVLGLHLQSGRTLWSVSVEGAVKSAPLFLSQKSLLIIGSHGRKVYAIDPRSPSNPVWVSSFDGSPIVAPIAATNAPVLSDQIFVGSLGGTVGCIDLRNPRRTIWSHGGMSPVFSKPTVWYGANGTRVTATPVDSTIHSYSAVTGECIWRTNRLSGSSNVFKDPLQSFKRNELFIVSNDGTLFDINALDGVFIWRESFVDGLLLDEPSSLNTPSLICNMHDSLEKQFLLLTRADGTMFLCAYQDANMNKLNSCISVVGSIKLPGLCFSNPVVFPDKESGACLVVTGCRDNNLHCFSITDC